MTMTRMPAAPVKSPSQDELSKSSKSTVCRSPVQVLESVSSRCSVA